MKIREFATTYCADILAAAEKRSTLFEISQYPYDEIVTEDDGTPVPVVYTQSHVPIPVADILGMVREEFVRVWSQECVAEYDNYLSNFIILEGEEVLSSIRNAIRAEQDRIAAYDDIPEVFR